MACKTGHDSDTREKNKTNANQSGVSNDRNQKPKTSKVHNVDKAWAHLIHTQTHASNLENMRDAIGHLFALGRLDTNQQGNDSCYCSGTHLLKLTCAKPHAQSANDGLSSQ
jgi:hypothetical protein